MFYPMPHQKSILTRQFQNQKLKHFHNYHKLGCFELTDKPIRYDDEFSILISFIGKRDKKKFTHTNIDLELDDRYNSGKG